MSMKKVKTIITYSEKNPYTNTALTNPGVRIFHVDARLIYYNSRGMIERTNTVRTSNGGTDIGPSNTPSKSQHPLLKRIHLLDARGAQNTWYHNGKKTSGNSALFQSGDKIAADAWQTYLFTSNALNSGTAIGYSVEIGAMDESGVTILFTKA